MNPDDLDPATKARIEAEEKYRAHVRGKIQQDARVAVSKSAKEKPPLAPSPAKENKGGSWSTWVLILIVLMAFIGAVQQYVGDSSPLSRSPVRSGPSDNERLGSFGDTCEKIVKDNIKAPAAAEFGNDDTDQREGTLG